MWVPLVVLAILSFSFWFKSPFVEKGWFQTLITKPATVANIAKAPAAPASMEHAAVMAPAARSRIRGVPWDAGPGRDSHEARPRRRMVSRSRGPRMGNRPPHGRARGGRRTRRAHRAYGARVRHVLLGGDRHPGHLPRLRRVLVRLDRPGPRGEQREAALQLPPEQVVLRRAVRQDGDRTARSPSRSSSPGSTSTWWTAW